MGGGAMTGAAGHGFGGFEEQGAAAVVETRERFGELAKFATFVAIGAPFVHGIGFVHGESFGRGGAVVEEAIERHFERAGVLFEGFDGGDGVSIFDA